jgi:magnesium transporter
MRICRLEKGNEFIEVIGVSINKVLDEILGGSENSVMILSPYELKTVSRHLKLPEHTVREEAVTRTSPMFESYIDMNFGVVADISVNTEKFRDFMSRTGRDSGREWDESMEFLIERRVTFYHTKKVLVVVRNGNDTSIDMFEKRLKNPTNELSEMMKTSWGALFILLNTITLLDDEAIGVLEELVESFEDSILSGRMMGVANDIVGIRKKLAYLKKKFEPMMTMAEELVANENGIIPESGIGFFRLYRGRIERLSNKILHQREYMSELRETYQAQLDISLNNTMKIFTVVTSLVLPLTFITGWFGMNFKYMSILEAPYAYEGVMAASACVVVAGLAFFRAKRLI